MLQETRNETVAKYCNYNKAKRKKNYIKRISKEIGNFAAKLQ